VVDVLADPPGTVYIQDPLPLMPEPAEMPRPAPESQLSPEQRRIRELEDLLAREMGRKDVEPSVDPEIVNGAEENIIIHILEDGFTALGKVWYRGEELEFLPGGGAYQDTCDRNGRSWLELRKDDFAQIERWGRIMFRNGPWPGKSLAEIENVSFEPLNSISGADRVAPTADEIRQAASKAARRGRAAPRLQLR